MDDGHPDKPVYLSHLGSSQQTRFGHLGELVDLENAISNQRRAVELADDKHPSKPAYLLNLGISQHTRFGRLGELADLENAISNQQKAVELTDDGHPVKPMSLSNLGNSQKTRFRRLGDLVDIENAISNQQKAVELTDDRSKPGCLSNLGISQQARFGCLGELADLENAISNQQKAVILTDDGHPSKPGRLSNLGNSQTTRFVRFGELGDLENAISNEQKAVELTDDGHPDKPMYLSNLGSSQETRFGRLGELADLENAISNKQNAVELTEDGHPDKQIYLSNLGISEETRFRRLGNLADLENAISDQQKVVKLTDDRHPSKPGRLSNLGISQEARFRRLGELADLENAISNQQKAVELTGGGHLSKARYLSNLGISQHTRFACLGELADIKSAILNITMAIDLTDVRDPHRSGYLLNLGLCQESIFAFLKAESHLAAAISAFKEAAHLNTAYPSTALVAARKWADVSRHSGDLSSALNGYRIALEILPRVAWLGLDPLSHRNHLLREGSESLGCLAATCAIQLGQLDEAVELLDLGRSVYWQQVSSLRSDLETLKEEDKDLANKLESVGRKLDAQKSYDSTLIGEDQSVGINKKEVVGKQRRLLVRQWENLVERVRQIPGFKYFLRPTPFAQLREAASVGQVIIINVSHYRVDALIFGATGPIEHVPLPDIDRESLSELSRNITTNRPVNASATRRRSYVARFLKPALRAIWDDIIVKIFNEVHISLTDTAVPPTRRIWWYPTGPLTFIPIHAAGPGRGVMGVSQLVISSYVTTLGSLLQLQKANGSVMKRQLKFLGISQLETPGESPLLQTVKEVDEVAEVLRSSGWTEGDILSLQGSDATVSRVSCALDFCSWVHFACHGSQDPILGMKSAF
jgi:tetratricopeptide (TPR) repeat protein